MRDPMGRLQLHDKTVVRRLGQPLCRDHFLNTPLARELVKQGKLIDFTSDNANTLQHPRIAFVTHPYEWCNEQFMQAAELTLEIAERIASDGFELKDASAWNILFDGGRPVFCDHLSFQKIQSPQWWPFGQYVRHFILPMVVHQHCGLLAQDVFKIHRDGLNPQTARHMLGPRRWLTRYWPLMLESKTPSNAKAAGTASTDKPRHQGLYASTRWFVNGLKKSGAAQTSNWVDYTQTRSHYSDHDSQQKAQIVRRWLEQIQPTWVTDLGCNTGEFSFMAHEVGAKVVSVDLDHESIQKLHNNIHGKSIYTVVANLDDFVAGRGWAGHEVPGLLQRLNGKADAVLVLALVHHLAISSSIPYEEIAALTAQLTRRYAIVELLHLQDPLVQHLAAQRQRSTEDFALERQFKAFELHFKCLNRLPLDNGLRELVLLEKTEP